MNNPIQNVKEKLTKQNLKTFLLITFGTFIFAIGIYFANCKFKLDTQR